MLAAMINMSFDAGAMDYEDHGADEDDDDEDNSENGRWRITYWFL